MNFQLDKVKLQFPINLSTKQIITHINQNQFNSMIQTNLFERIQHIPHIIY